MQKVRIQLYLSPADYERLKIAQREKASASSLSNFVAEHIIHEYLENESDLIGTRKHFKAGFQKRIDQIEAQLYSQQAEQAWLLNLLLNTLVHVLAQTEMMNTEQPRNRRELFRDLIIDTLSQADFLDKAIRSSLEKYQEKRHGNHA